MYYLLHYNYIPDIVEKREPHRPGHLELLRAYEERGELILAGPVGDPFTGAAFTFKVDSVSVIEDFVRQDPYVQNGLVPAHRIEPWTVVIGAAYEQ